MEGSEEMTEMSHVEKKEEEQAVIQRHIEATNAQLETLERIEASGNGTLTEEELLVSTSLLGLNCTNN